MRQVCWQACIGGLATEAVTSACPAAAQPCEAGRCPASFAAFDLFQGLGAAGWGLATETSEPSCHSQRLPTSRVTQGRCLGSPASAQLS